MALSEKAKEQRRAYRRAWAKANPDKVREYQERYWTRRAEQTEQQADAPKEENY